MLAVYRGLTWVAAPAVRAYVARRAARGKENAERLAERFGHAARPRPAGRLVWAHAASVGESLALLPLITRLVADDPALRLLVTTGTVTSAEMLARRLPERAIHQFAPVDLPQAVSRFLDHWRPDLALWVESEIWPNLIGATARRRIPMALINARVSARSFRRWRRAPGLSARLLSAFTVCLAQSETDASRLRALGAADVRVVGNLKFAAAPLPADAQALADLGATIAGRPRWLAASTHPGEEEIVAAAHRALKTDFPDLLLLLAPRHPGRGPEIAAALAAEGFSVARRAAGALPEAGHDIYLADTLGELGMFFRLAPVSVVGGSFAPHGGHNPFEPALIGSAIVFGPHMENFSVIARDLVAAGGAVQVEGDAAMAGPVGALLRDAALREAAIAAASGVAKGYAGVLDATLAALHPWLAGTGADARP